MALEIFRLVGSVFVDTESAQQSLHKTDKKVEGVGKRFVGALKSAGKFAAGVVAGATAAGAAVVTLAETTREYRNEQAKLVTAFGAADHTAAEAKKTYQTLNGILGDSGQAVEAANHLAALCDTQEQLTTWTTISTGVLAKFGDSLPIEGLTEAANMAAKTGEVSGGLADALDWAGYGAANMTAALEGCSTEQERMQLITTTMNGLYADEAALFEENNKEVIAANKAQDKLNDAMAKAGKLVEPLVTKGKELVAKVVTVAIPKVVQLAKETGRFAKDAYAWAKKNKTGLTVLGIAIGTITTALIVYNGVRILKTALDTAATGVTLAAAAAQWVATAATTAWGAAVAFLTSPITLVIAAIGALIAIIYLLVKNWDDVKAAAIRCWEGIKEAFSDAGDWISGVFGKALDKVKSLWQGAKDWFRGLLDGIKDLFSTAAQAVGNCFKAPINWIIDGINKFIRGLNGIKIPTWVPSVGGKGFNIATLPHLAQGGVLERGQIGLLEGNGAEAVVPLHNNRKWISAVADDMEHEGIGSGSDTLERLLDAFLDFVAALLPAVERDKVLKLNEREFARLVKAVN